MDLAIYDMMLIVAFFGIAFWAFGRKRKSQFEKDGRMPFKDGKD